MNKTDPNVGYRRPPPGRKFEPGRSGNPKGRPRNSQSLSAEIDRALSERVEIKENGKKKKVTKGAAAAKQLANASAGGNLQAIKLAATMAQGAAAGAPEPDAPLMPAEAEIAERLVARIRQGWRPDDDNA